MERIEALRAHEQAEGTALAPIAASLDRHRSDIDAVKRDVTAVCATFVDKHDALAEDVRKLGAGLAALETHTTDSDKGLSQRIMHEVDIALNMADQAQNHIDAFRDRTFWQRLNWLVRGR